MASDASLITGEFYQDHPLVTYQSQGQDRGIDLQYTSLQANDQPIVGGVWPLQSEDPVSFTTMTMSLLVDGVSQGDPITINNIPSSNEFFLVVKTTLGVYVG
jgi:hypothetical protein